MNLWPHQTRALELIRAAIAAGHRRICVVSPTGSGKGTLAAEILKLAVARGGKGLFIVHRREIILDQLTRLAGVDAGVILPGANSRPYADVQIASTSTLLNRLASLPPASVIIIDECHHYASAEWSKLVEAYPDAIIIGITATSERGDGRPLKQFEVLIEAAKYSELIRNGLIVPCRVYQPAERIDNGLATDPVDAYEKYAPGTKGFCFVSNLELARTVAARFSERGAPAEVIEGKTAKRTRDLAVAKLRTGELRMIVNFATMTEGVDVADATTCILARACNHTGTYLQCVGRVLRSSPGKRFATLLDLVGASLVHGLPHIDREYSLDGRSAFNLSSLPPLTVCASCGLTQLAGRSQCESCGFQFLRSERKQPVIYSEELRAVFDYEQTPIDAKLDEFLRLVEVSASRGFSIDWVARTYGELFGGPPPVEWFAGLPAERKKRELEQWRAFAAERGFRPGYSYCRYVERFGHAP